MLIINLFFKRLRIKSHLRFHPEDIKFDNSPSNFTMLNKKHQTLSEELQPVKQAAPFTGKSFAEGESAIRTAHSQYLL